IPEDIEVFADLAVGLDFMIEDLRELNRDQDQARVELERRISHRTFELEEALKGLEVSQKLLLNQGWQDYIQASNDGEAFNYELQNGTPTSNPDSWLPGMESAITGGKFEITTNGHNKQSLSLPIQLQDEVIGVIGFDRPDEQPWTEREIATAEAIVEQLGLTLENQRLYDQSQTALAEADTLYQASAELNIGQTYQDVLNVIKKYTVIGQSSQFISINLFDQPWIDNQTPQTITPVEHWTPKGTLRLEGFPTRLSEWVHINDVLKIDQMTTIRNLENNPLSQGAVRSFFYEYLGGHSLISIPMVTAGRWIGQVLASFEEDMILSESDTRRLTSLAGQAAVAMQNIELLEETARKAGQLETAADIAREASSTLDVDILLNKAVNLIHERFGYYHASIFLKQGNMAVIAASTGDAGRQLLKNNHNYPLQEDTSIIGTVTLTGDPLVVNDVSQIPTHRPHPLLPDTRSQLGIPLRVGDRITGALDVQSTEINAFSDDDIAVLRTLADQIAVAVENARSFEVSQRAVVEMREIDQLKSEFLANMSHELRTPLNSIIGFSRVILKGIDGPINELQEQDLGAIHNSGQHLLDMINNILDVSKIEAGKMELSIENMNLDEIISSVMSTIRGLLSDKEIMLINNTSDTLPNVMADRTRVRQVLLNLLQNATKFTDTGSITLDMEEIIDPDSGQKMAQLSVKDTGIGISQEDQKNLFERFSQVDSSLTRKVGGTGLGLSISLLLVEMQGGKIWVESESGTGSTFYFTLPLSTVKTVEKIDEKEFVATGEKIIISIDDDEKIVGLYKRYINT
ncbi:MAG: GAF domain-containing protein, partial [Chloroflexota bacterium]